MLVRKHNHLPIIGPQRYLAAKSLCQKRWLEDLGGCSVSNFTFVQDKQGIKMGRNQIEIVGSQQYRNALISQVIENLEQGLLGQHVHAAEWLIQEQDAG